MNGTRVVVPEAKRGDTDATTYRDSHWQTVHVTRPHVLLFHRLATPTTNTVSNESHH